MKKILSVVGILAVVGLGYFFLKPTATKSYAMDEVVKHASREDCWILIEGKVYDVTKFIPMHKGKDAILMGCGKDATELFNNRPNGSGAHSSVARSVMKKFAIGELTK